MPVTELSTERPAACDRRAPSSVGREARLEVEFERRRGRTVIARAYVEPPFRIGRAFELDDAAYVIIVCSGPGVFAGDALTQSVVVHEGARVVLASQAALQIHPSPAPRPAAIHQRYLVDADAELLCQWDPVIPFSGARLVQRVDLRTHNGSRLFWGDALMSGRVSRGEAWRFDLIDHELRFSVGSALCYLERYRVSPVERPVDRAWIGGGAHYFGTTLVRHDRASEAAAEALQHELDAVCDVRAGVDTLEPGVLLARVLSSRGSAFASARDRCRRFALGTLFESPGLLGRRSV
jgi:urease accessory protein